MIVCSFLQDAMKLSEKKNTVLCVHIDKSFAGIICTIVCHMSKTDAKTNFKVFEYACWGGFIHVEVK